MAANSETTIESQDSVLVATFGLTTAWVGKTIRFRSGQFLLEGQGAIEATAVRDYDQQGHLIWAYAGLREWVVELAEHPDVPTAVKRAQAERTTPEQDERSTVDASPGLSPSMLGPARRWVLPTVMLVLLTFSTLLATALQGGYLRNGLGVGFTVCAVTLVGLLIWSLIRPGALGPCAPRWMVAGGQGVMLLAVSCVLCLGMAAILWWVPHYEVIVPGDKRVILDSSPEMTVEVSNRGLFPGTFSATYSVAGVAQSPVEVYLASGETQPVSLPLSPSSSRAPHLLQLGSVGILAEVVLPATFRVRPLKVSAPVAKVGQGVRVDATVRNVGDIAGNFPGSLRVNGTEVDASPSTIGPGQSAPLSLVFSRSSPGRCRIQLGNARKTVMVVHPIRPESGKVLRRKISDGPAHLTVKNLYSFDAMVVLSRTSSPLSPVLAVYMRPHSSTTVHGIPDGRYYIWDSTGSDWNAYMGDFLTDATHARARKALTFSTSSSTRYWSEGYMNYWQTTNNWTNWTHWVAIGSDEYCAAVSPHRFPHL